MTRPTPKPRRKVLVEGWALIVRRDKRSRTYSFLALVFDRLDVAKTLKSEGRIVPCQLVEVPERKKWGDEVSEPNLTT